MSLNIQTATGLLEISTKITKEKVISALGYEPADKAHTEDKTVHVTSAEKETWNNKSDVKHYDDLEGAPSITENDSGSMVVADENGNIIMQVDADGLATTNVSAKTISLDGEDLGERLDELEAKTSNIVDDESGKVEFADEAGNVIARINASGFETTTVTAKNIIANGVDITTYVDTQVANLVDSSPETLNTLNELADALGDDPNFATTVATQIGLKADQTSLDTHESNKIAHITEDERATWNAKSNFSGDYNELINAPNITEDSSGSVVYSDEQGNIIVKVDANGLETTTVTAQSVVVNGVDVETALDGKAASEHTHSQYLVANDIINKADKSYVDTELAKKADTNHAHDDSYYTKFQIDYVAGELNSAIAEKADKTELHNHSNKTELDKIVDGKVAYWDAKSDFSGKYTDLEDAPNITEDDSDNLVIADRDGNIIFRSDGAGFETTTLTAQSVIVNGTDVEEALKTKLDKEEGKGLSSNDFTTEEKEKLAELNKSFTINVGDNNITDKTYNEIAQAFVDGEKIVVVQNITKSFLAGQLEYKKEYAFVDIDATTTAIVYKFSYVQNGVIHKCEIIQNMSTEDGSGAATVIFAEPIDIGAELNNKSDIDHTHNYDDVELITVDDIDRICGMSIRAINVQKDTF